MKGRYDPIIEKNDSITQSKPDVVDVFESPVKGSTAVEISDSPFKEIIEISDSPVKVSLESHVKRAHDKVQSEPKEPKQKLKFEILRFSENKIDSSNSKVKNELKKSNRELTYEILKFSEDESESSDLCNDTEEDTYDTQEEISFRGRRKYINPNVFADLEPEKRSAVPMDIDGVCIFTVPMLKNGSLNNCKGGRPWGRAISSNLSGRKKGQRLLFNCKGSYICPCRH